MLKNQNDMIRKKRMNTKYILIRMIQIYDVTM